MIFVRLKLWQTEANPDQIWYTDQMEGPKECLLLMGVFLRCILVDLGSPKLPQFLPMGNAVLLHEASNLDQRRRLSKLFCAILCTTIGHNHMPTHMNEHVHHSMQGCPFVGMNNVSIKTGVKTPKTEIL